MQFISLAHAAAIPHISRGAEHLGTPRYHSEVIGISDVTLPLEEGPHP
jgi:hypothetical protein